MNEYYFREVVIYFTPDVKTITSKLSQNGKVLKKSYFRKRIACHIKKKKRLF